MCVICASAKGVKQPTTKQIKTMFQTNPHGAGYMVARGSYVEIRKGFMTCDELLEDIERAQLTADDAVVYHFRISTQAGVTEAMTHPFPLTRDIKRCKDIYTESDIGVAHNGIIHLTSNPQDREYNDTAHFIAEYMSFLIRNKSDITNNTVISSILTLTRSKWAILHKDGTLSTIGCFIREKDGLLFSNSSYKDFSLSYFSNF